MDRYSFYTPELNLLAESEASTSVGKAIRYSYVWFAGQPLAQIDNSTGEIAHYFNDHLGTPVLQTSSTPTKLTVRLTHTNVEPVSVDALPFERGVFIENR